MTYSEVLEKAAELAALLNTVEHDDERERLEQEFERRLNDELHRGSEIRAMHRLDAGADLVEHPTVSRIRKGVEVATSDGREGLVAGFMPQPTGWANGGPSRSVFAVVEFADRTRQPFPALSLRVLETVSEGGSA